MVRFLRNITNGIVSSLFNSLDTGKERVVRKGPLMPRKNGTFVLPLLAIHSNTCYYSRTSMSGSELLDPHQP